VSDDRVSSEGQTYPTARSLTYRSHIHGFVLLKLLPAVRNDGRVLCSGEAHIEIDTDPSKICVLEPISSDRTGSKYLNRILPSPTLPSQPLPPRRSDSLPKHRTPNHIPQPIKRIHACLHPQLIHLRHELSDGLLGRLTRRIVRYTRRVRPGRPPSARRRLMQQHKPHVTPRNETADFDDVERGMHDELVHIPRGLAVAEAGDAIATGFGGAKGEFEERGVGRRDDAEVV
jgi:hypothetical protein